MKNEKDIKIEPLQTLIQIRFKYGKMEGTVVIEDEFDKGGFDSYISDNNFEYSQEEENEIVRLVYKKFLKEYSERMKRDTEL